MEDCSCSYIELHFYTEDGSHTMNAESLNRCVYEYLGIIKEVSSKFHVGLPEPHFVRGEYRFRE